MATVTIKELKVKAHIGIEPHELKAAQEVVFDISFEYDERKAARSDDIRDAVDYKALQEKIRNLLKRSRFNLVEKLAHEVLWLSMTDKRVRSAVVTVSKSKALKNCHGVSLTVSAKR